jgi:thiol-disulfide isomerase/thioredoxin
MRRFLFMLACLLAAQPAAAVPPMPTAKLIAVYFYADWCPNCKILGPKLQQARDSGQLDAQKVLFVKIDLTDKPRINQSILLAQALGIGDFLKAQGSGTGYVALLDASSKKELARFDRESTAQDITQQITNRLN